MIRQILSQLGVLLLLIPVPGIFPRAVAQDRPLPMDKILNPMPEYDPFEKAGTQPQFFPDEVDKRARELMIDALTQRKDAMEAHLRALQVEDKRLQKDHGAVTGLTAHARTWSTTRLSTARLISRRKGPRSKAPIRRSAKSIWKRSSIRMILINPISSCARAVPIFGPG